MPEFNDYIVTIFLILSGLTLPISIFLIFYLKKSDLNLKLKEANILAERLGIENATLTERLGEVNQKFIELLQENAALEAALYNERENSQVKEEFSRDVKKQFLDSFEALSGRALEQSAKLFLNMAESQLSKQSDSSLLRMNDKQDAINKLISPIHESLEQLNKKIRAVEDERLSSQQQINSTLEQVLKSQQKVSKETVVLANSLKSPTIAGQWGEMHLRRVVEAAGLLEYCDFNQQVTLESEDAICRPDLVVNLPGGRKVILDSKVPIKDYLLASAVESLDQKKIHLDHHCRALKKHIQNLSRKRYQESLPGALDQVLLFLPSEGLMRDALQQQPDLFDFAITNKVLLTTPLSLLATLKAIALGWQQDRVLDNSLEIAELGSKLLKRLYTFSEHFMEIHRGLDTSVKAFNNSLASLESRVMVTAKQLSEAGVNDERSAPPLKMINNGLRHPVIRTQE